MNENEIKFAKRIRGYDIDAVNRRVRELTNAYQTAYAEYTAACAKYNELLGEYNAAGGGKNQIEQNAEVIAKMFVDTELMAQRILEDAKAEADKRIGEARDIAQKIVEDANFEQTAAAMHAKKLIDDAGAETARARERARLIVVNARAEARRAEYQTKRCVDQANVSVTQLIGALQNLIQPETPANNSQKTDTACAG